MNQLELLSWALAALVTYTFLGYPVAVWVTGRIKGVTPRRRGVFAGSCCIVITAHNEERRIRRRLLELRKLTARDRRVSEIIVVSDGSTDNTVACTRRVHGVTVVDLPVRRGKAAALNAGAAASDADVLIFADVRQRWANDAVKRLLENFSDEAIGGVSGDLQLEAGPNKAISGIGLYWRVEKWLRRHESQIHSSIGVTGAISAVRRKLFPALPEGTLLDDVYWPMVVVTKGFRIVHDEQAVAFDRLPPAAIGEFHRKVRTLAGNYQLIELLPSLLVPWKNPVWIQFLSHKVLRLTSPWALLGLLAITATLDDIPYQHALFLMQLGGYAYALIALNPTWGKLLPFAGAGASFLVVNAAAFGGFWVWYLGGTRGVWRKVSYDNALESVAS